MSPNRGEGVRPRGQESAAGPSLNAAPPGPAEAEAAFPHAPEPGVFAELSHPGASLTSPAQAAAKGDEPTSPQKVGPLTWLKRAATTLLTSSEICSGLGSTILSLGTGTISGVILHPISSVFGAINAFRHKYFPSQFHQEGDQKEVKSGAWAFLSEKLNSPGVYRIVTATVFTANAIEAMFRKDPVTAAIFGLCVSANAAGARLLNHNLNKAAREATRIENLGRKLWDALPESVQTMLANPTIAFSAASVLIGARDMTAASFGSPLVLASFSLAALAMGHGSVQALRAGAFSEPRPMSFILSGLSQIAMAFSNLAGGNAANGASLLCYAGSNFIFAGRMALRQRQAA